MNKYAVCAQVERVSLLQSGFDGICLATWSLESVGSWERHACVPHYTER